MTVEHLEEGTWFAVPKETPTPYGADRRWDIWNKNVDCSEFEVCSREDIDDLIKLLTQARELLPPDDETDFAKSVLGCQKPK